MEKLLASRSVSVTELKRSPSAVLDQAGSEPVAILNHNRPAAYLLPHHVYEAMLERLKADLCFSIQEGIERAATFSPKSRQDLIDIGDYIAKHSRENALRFVEQLISQCRRIGLAPRS